MMPGTPCCRFLHMLVVLTIICLGTCESLPCNWITEVRQKLDPYIAGDPYDVTLDQAEGLEDCKMRCVKESTFICAAVNYRQYDRRCELLEENDQTAVPHTDSNYQYSLRPICAGFWQPWTAAATASILSSGVKTINDTDTEDLRSCMSRCEQHVGDMTCSSIVKSRMNSNKTCGLVGKLSDYELQYEPSSEWQYFDRPSWYLDSVPGARNVIVKKRSDRGSDYVILNNNPIEADGYLVAWQYYTRSSDIPCPTFAAVWNEVPGNNRNRYNLLSETPLYSGSPDAITFHFITGAIVKVKQGYVPSTYVRDSQGCAGNLISFGSEYSEGYYGSPESIKNISVGDVLNVTRSEPRAVSLRPFIAEYLVVAELSADISQVPTFGAKIRWGDPIGYLSLMRGQQNISGGGFQLTCSTSDSFSNGSLVPCVSATASILYRLDTKSAILSLPSSTQHYYARIEVVRNFNGNKIVDEKHKDIGPFCTRRYMMRNDQVEVHDTGLLRPEEQRSVSLRFSLIDSCIQSVVVYVGSGQLADEPHTTNEWSFTKQQGANFTIRAIANLIGGYHQDVWIGQYTTKKAPQAPAALRIIERLRHSAWIAWEAINNYTDARITEYQVDCKVSNSSFNMEADLYSSLPLTFTTHTDVSDIVAYGLLPQVQYKCQVKALLKAGGFGYSSSYISLWTKPQYPMLSISSASIETVVYDVNVTITLPNVTAINNFDRRFASLWIAVKKEGSSRRKRFLATTSKLTIDGISTYIAAKIALEKTSNTFIVGDGKMYGGSTNKELELGDYTIYVGYQAVTEEEVTEYYQLNQKPLRVILPDSNITPTPRPTPRAMIGGIVAGLLAVVVVILLVVIFLQHRCREKTKHPPGSQMSGHVDISSEGMQSNDEYEEVGEGNLIENPTSAATALISRGSDTFQNTSSSGAAKYEMVDISGQAADQHVYSNLNN